MIEESHNLKNLSSFKIGGDAEYYSEVKNKDELLEAINFAQTKNLNITTLGSASNVVIADEGIKGLVIKFMNKNIEEVETNNEYSLITAGSGTIWDDFVEFCVSKNLYGVENLSLIPGTVGACGIQNIGAYGQQASNTIHSMECYDLKKHEFVSLSNADCNFAYRTSAFNSTEKNRYIVCNVTFKLLKQAEFLLKYKDMAYFRNDKDLSLAKVREEIIKIRTNKLPDYTKIPNVGSFFKNLELTREEFSELVERASQINKEEAQGLDEFDLETDIIKVPTAYLIDHILNLKGFKWENIGIHENHSLILVNHSKNGTSKEVLDFADFITNTLYEKLGVKVQREPTFIS